MAAHMIKYSIFLSRNKSDTLWQLRGTNNQEKKPKILLITFFYFDYMQDM